MKVSELGEFGLIELLTKIVYRAQDKQIPAGQKLIIGIGDDAAAWRGDDSIQLATADSFIQDVHFSLDITPWKDLGWKALTVNLSDIAAMGGVPQYAIISLALPENTAVDDVTTLYRGMIELAQLSGVAIVGGDTSSAPQVTINITVLGNTGSQYENILTRSGAIAGDRIAVSGYLGAASAGREMLTEHLRFDTAATVSLKEAFLHPYPRIVEGQLLLEQGIKAAIDISDGLISDLNHMCQASQLGARIDIDCLPIHPDVRANFGDRALELALSGGEDYELLFTGSTEAINKITTIAPCPITLIGEMVGKAGKVTLVNRQGNPLNLRKGGWEHFTKK